MKIILFVCLIALSHLVHAEKGVKLSIIRTGTASTFENLTLENGDWKQIAVNHSAFLIEHPMGNILVDTGLGEKIDEQFNNEVPFIYKPAFAYKKGETVKAQLKKAKVDFSFILITHLHFDHVSGLVDYLDKDVWALPEEIAFKDVGSPPAVLKSQVSNPNIKWRPYAFTKRPYLGFPESLDIYGDQSIVVVPLKGHTPGSVGIFVNTESGKKIFLIGDTVWKKKGIDLELGKFWLSKKLVDHDEEKVLEQIKKLHAFQETHPEIILVPSHDESIQAEFGYFPKRL